MICPDCGCPPPSNGICYNCLKNENDANRFGRGSGNVPAHIKYSPRGNIRRYKDPGPIVRTRTRNKNQDQSSQPVSDTPAREKPTTIPRRSPRLIRKRSTRVVRLPKHPLRGIALARQRRGVNDFLHAVYKRPILISDILRQEGFSAHQVRFVQGKAALYLLKLVTAWCHHWKNDLISRRIFIVASHYSFGGEFPRDPRYFARRFNRPVENVIHDLNGAISQLRRPDRTKQIEKVIVETAWKVLHA